MRKRFGLFTPSSASGAQGDSNTPNVNAGGSGGLGLSGVRADVLGNIEHDRLANAVGVNGVPASEGKGAGDRGLGGILGGIIQEGVKEAEGPGTGEVKVEEEKEVKMKMEEEEEEL